MKTTAYRVRQILTGDMPGATVVAVDTSGREVRLEVGAVEGRSIQVDEVLVLTWATLEVPNAANPVVTGTIVDDAAEMFPEDDPASESSESDAGGFMAKLDDFRELVGLS